MGGLRIRPAEARSQALAIERCAGPVWLDDVLVDSKPFVGTGLPVAQCASVAMMRAAVIGGPG